MAVSRADKETEFRQLQDAFSGSDYWPDGMCAQTFYTPTERGFEKRLSERLAYWDALRAEKRS